MKIINFEETISALNFNDAIVVMKQCFRDYTEGVVSQNNRKIEVLPDEQNKNIFAMMPAYLGKERYFGAKIITAFPNNRLQNLPSHLGEILLFDSKNGIPVAMIDANAVTWIRTAAVSALATDYLAKPNASTLTLIGTGQQASSHLKAISCIRSIEKVYIYDIDQDNRQVFINRMSEEYPKINFINCSTLKDSLKETDIVCTLTSSKEAFLEKKLVPKGTHINAIGTFTPDTREIASDLMRASEIIVDDYNAALTESGDLLIPISEKILDEESIMSSLGELVTGEKEVKYDNSKITIFDAVGLAVEDLCCAEYIYKKLEKSKYEF